LSGQYGTSGYSMGGGGTMIASAGDKTLRSSVGLAPWLVIPETGIVTPTLHFCGDVDIVADCSHAQSAYDAIPATTSKMLITISGCDHLACWFGPADSTDAISGGWALAFNKVFLEGDERWRPLLLMKPSRGTVQTNIKAAP
jgi:triacylglycerol lipase